MSSTTVKRHDAVEILPSESVYFTSTNVRPGTASSLPTKAYLYVPSFGVILDITDAPSALLNTISGVTDASYIFTPLLTTLKTISQSPKSPCLILQPVSNVPLSVKSNCAVY